MTYRLRNIGLALALALGAVLLVFYYVGQERNRLQDGEELVAVWVATKNIPEGTAGSTLESGGYVKKDNIERDLVAPGALLNPSEVGSKLVANTIYKGEQVSQLRFRSEAEKGIRGQLTGTLRAVQVPGSKDQLLAGTLESGDRVDIVATMKYKFVNFGQAPDGAGANEELTATPHRAARPARAPPRDVVRGCERGHRRWCKRRARRTPRGDRRPVAEAELRHAAGRPLLDTPASAGARRRRQPGERRDHRNHPHRRPQGQADRNSRPRKEQLMTVETPVATREQVRIFLTGSCDGLDGLRESLERQGEIELVGSSAGVAESAAALAGGHLQVVLHATRSTHLPADELAAIREHTRAPVILLASGEAVEPARGGARSRRRRRPGSTANGRERRLRDPQSEPVGLTARPLSPPSAAGS